MLGLILTAVLLAANPTVLTGEVVAVTDGDTVIVLGPDKQQHKIRLASIDAPERSQANGNGAREALAKIIFRKKVKVDWSAKDKFGRILGDVYVDDRWINKEMIVDGWAWHYRQYSDSAELADAEKKAQASSRGVWKDKAPEPPWNYRQNEATRAAAKAARPVIVKKPKIVVPKEVEPIYSLPASSGVTHVKGYYRKDGTYVRPHTRRSP